MFWLIAVIRNVVELVTGSFFERSWKMERTIVRMALVLVAICGILICTSAQAAPNSVVTTGATNWTTASIWKYGLPGTSDTAFVGGYEGPQNGVNVTVNTTPTNVAGLIVGYTSNATLTITADGSLTAGEVQVGRGNYRFSDYTNWYGTLNLAGTLTTGLFRLGYHNDANWKGQGVVNQSAGSLTVTGAGAFVMGDNDHYVSGGSATYNQTGGTVSIGGNATIGRYMAGSTYNLQTTADATTDFYVGGEFIITEQSPAAGSSFRRVSGDMTANGRARIGYRGAGTLEVQGGNGDINLNNAVDFYAASTLLVKPDVIGTSGARISSLDCGNSVTIASGARFDLEFTTNPQVNDLITIINKTSAGAISGFFMYDDPSLGLTGLTGLTYTAPGVGGNITFTTLWGGSSYNGGDGNDLVLQILSAPSPEVNVLGNSPAFDLSILDGDATPSLDDDTDFGSTPLDTYIDRIFRVQNTGDLALTVSGLTVPDGFSIIDGFDAASIPASSYDDITIRLLATSAGTFAGDISFTNGDTGESPYNFRITGEVTAAVPEPAALSLIGIALLAVRRRK